MLGSPSFLFSFRACGVLLLPAALTLCGVLAPVLFLALLATLRIPGGLVPLKDQNALQLRSRPSAMLACLHLTSPRWLAVHPHVKRCVFVLHGCHIARMVARAWSLLSTPNTGTTAIFSPGNTHVPIWRLIASAAVAGNWLLQAQPGAGTVTTGPLSHRCIMASFSGFSHIAALLHIMEADLIA